MTGTVNGVDFRVEIQEEFLYAFGQFQYRRPRYRIVVHHGPYANRLTCTTSRKLAQKIMMDEATQFMQKTYPPPAPPTVPPPAPVQPDERDLLAILFGPEPAA